jgi:phosphatidylglycerol lysyltransferase
MKVFMRSAALESPAVLDHEFVLAARGTAVIALDEPRNGLGAPRRFSRIDWTRIGVLLGLTLFGVAAYVLYRTLEQVTWIEVQAALGRISIISIAGAALATAGSYLALVAYDLLALRQTGARHISTRFATFTSLVSHALSFTLGFGMLSGGALRLRLYQSQGLAPGHILVIGVFCAIAFWMGFAAVTGLCLIAEPAVFALVGGVGASVNFAIGAAILSLLAAWIVATAIRPRHIAVGAWTLQFPSPAASAGAVIAGIFHTSFAALVLWLLLPAAANISFTSFLEIFIAATLIAVVSYVPGGLGVFEAVMLLALPELPAAETIGALALFRAIYYIAPFTLATGALALFELRGRLRPSDEERDVSAAARLGNAHGEGA